MNTLMKVTVQVKMKKGLQQNKQWKKKLKKKSNKSKKNQNLLFKNRNHKNLILMMTWVGGTTDYLFLINIKAD